MVQLVRLRLIQGLALISALVSLSLICIRPDIERYLKQNMPGNPMPDAFRGLNGTMTMFTLFVTATAVLALRIEIKRRYVLLLPLMFGPTACFTGWCLTENFNDPNWFHLFALTTIGMLVSCLVTAILSAVTKKTTEQTIGHEALDRPF